MCTPSCGRWLAIAGTVIHIMIFAVVVSVGAYAQSNMDSLERSVCFGSFRIELLALLAVVAGSGMLLAGVAGLVAVWRSKRLVMGFWCAIFFAAIAFEAFASALALWGRDAVLKSTIEDNWTKNPEQTKCFQAVADCCGYNDAQPETYGCLGGYADRCQDKARRGYDQYAEPLGILMLILVCAQALTFLGLAYATCNAERPDERGPAPTFHRANTNPIAFARLSSERIDYS
jgi:hypothetical protein